MKKTINNNIYIIINYYIKWNLLISKLKKKYLKLIILM